MEWILRPVSSFERHEENIFAMTSFKAMLLHLTRIWVDESDELIKMRSDLCWLKRTVVDVAVWSVVFARCNLNGNKMTHVPLTERVDHWNSPIFSFVVCSLLRIRCACLKERVVKKIKQKDKLPFQTASKWGRKNITSSTLIQINLFQWHHCFQRNAVQHFYQRSHERNQLNAIQMARQTLDDWC